MEDTKTVLYPNLEAEIARKGESYTTLGKILGLSPSAVSKRMDGQTRWNADEIAKVCKHFDMTFEELF